MPAEVTILFVCPRCFSVDLAAGPCPRCKLPRQECNPGPYDSPRRRPPTTADGRLQSRAPLWWVVQIAPYLRRRA